MSHTHPLYKLNLACGTRAKKGYVNIDKANIDCVDRLRDILYGLPYCDECVTEIRIEHFLEHLQAHQFIRLMNECYRVLTKKGRLYIAVPHLSGPHAVIDPTHVRLFREESFNFWTRPDINSYLSGVNGYFKEISMENKKGELQVWLEKNTEMTNDNILGRK